MANRHSKVSLCMIVKDEAALIGRCLESAKPYVDEICVVDTGSTDNTIAIAESFGARMASIPWPDDFAEARNHSLDMATGDWILVLDADEVLRAGQEAEFNAVVDEPKAIAGFQRFANHSDNKPPLNCLILRLFRNMPTHRFAGVIHEQIMTPILANAEALGLRIVDEILDIDHYGYMAEIRTKKDKDKRDRWHFEKALAKEPDNPYLWFRYGDFLRRFDDIDAVITALERACEMIAGLDDEATETLTYAAEPHALLALELIKLGRMEAAEERLRLALEKYCPTAMLHWVWGHYSLHTKQWQQAYDAFAACHALDGKIVHVPAQPGITAGRSVFGMARALLELDRKDEALTMFSIGQQRWPDCEDLVKANLRIGMSNRDFQGSMAACTAWLKDNPEDGEAWQIGSEMLMELGLWDQAGIWLDRARASMKPEHAGCLEALQAEHFLGQGRLEAALDAWNAHFAMTTSQVGLTLIFCMVQEPTAVEIDTRTKEFRRLFAAVLQRLSVAPEGAAMFELLHQSLAAGTPLDADLKTMIQGKRVLALA